MCTGFSTSDLRQKTQQFQRQCARVFPPATSAISKTMCTGFPPATSDKILSNFKDRWTDFFHAEISSKNYQSHQERRLTTSFSYQIVGKAKPHAAAPFPDSFLFLHEHPPKRERRLLAKGKTMSR